MGRTASISTPSALARPTAQTAYPPEFEKSNRDILAAPARAAFPCGHKLDPPPPRVSRYAASMARIAVRPAISFRFLSAAFKRAARAYSSTDIEPPEERKRRVVAVAERFGHLRRVCLHDAGVTVGKIEGKEVNLPRHAADHRHRLAEVRLGVTGRMDERHEHLAQPKSPLANEVRHDDVTARKAVLVPKTVEDALSRAPSSIAAREL